MFYANFIINLLALNLYSSYYNILHLTPRYLRKLFQLFFINPGALKTSLRKKRKIVD